MFWPTRLPVLAALSSLPIAAALLAAPPPAHACTQPPGGHRQYSVADRTQAAEVVVVGTVTAMAGQPGSIVTSISVEQIIKGTAPWSIDATRYGAPSICESDVRVGQRGIFFLRSRPDGSLEGNYMSAHDAVAPATAATIAEAVGVSGQPPQIRTLTCSRLNGRVPPAVLSAAMADPATIRGYGRLRNPNLAEHPTFNPPRLSISIERPSVPYHPIFNGLVARAGCP